MVRRMMTRGKQCSMIRSCLTALLLVLAVSAVAYGCPNCKDAMGGDPAQAGLIRGFFWSILFMVSMPFLIFGGVGGYFYWEVCRARRATAGLSAATAGSGTPFQETADVRESEPLAVG
jgi:heme/copper-type cytochrome/quinol oxidase subunit 2